MAFNVVQREFYWILGHTAQLKRNLSVESDLVGFLPFTAGILGRDNNSNQVTSSGTEDLEERLKIHSSP